VDNKAEINDIYNRLTANPIPERPHD
jgi:hypothetical protein